MPELITDPIEQAWDQAIKDTDPAFTLHYARDILYSTERLGKTRSFIGLNHSQRTNPARGIYTGHRPYDAGYPQNLDVVSTLANHRALSYSFYSRSAPDTLHIGLDFPGRIDRNTGKYSLRKIGLMAMLLAIGVASATNTRVSVKINESNHIKKTPVLSAMTAAYTVIDSELIDDTSNYDMQEGGSTIKLIEDVRSSARPKMDTALLILDGLDGYSNEQHKFEWQDSLQEMRRTIGDSLMVILLESPAQDGPTPGISRNISIGAGRKIRKRYAEHMAELRAAQAIALEGIRVIRINGHSNPEHPVPAILKFLTEAK